MRILKALMLGAGGSVLLAGGAMAADPMPVVVTTVPTVVVPEPSREVLIDVAAETYFSIHGGVGITASIGGIVDVTSATGWGVRFEGATYAQLVPSFSGYTFGVLTLYRAFGDLDIGIWAGAGTTFPGPNLGTGLGLSATYWHEGERLYVWSANTLQLFPGIDFDTYTELEFDLTDRLTLSSYFDYYGGFDGGVGIDVALNDRFDVWSNLFYNGGGLDALELGTKFAVTERFSVWAEAEVDFVPFEFDDLHVGMIFELNEQLTIKNQLSIALFPFAFDYIDVWMELDRPIGTGPLSLTAELGTGFEQGYGAYVWGNIGLRYKLGVPEDHDDNRLFGDDW